MRQPRLKCPEDLRTEYESGATLSGLARKHRVAHKTVKRWLIAQAVPIRTPRGPAELTPEQARRVQWLLKDGASLTSMARFVDLHPNTLESWIRRQR